MKDLFYVFILLYATTVYSAYSYQDNNLVTMTVDDFSNGTKLIECRVNEITAHVVNLICPISQRSDKACFSGCSNTCRIPKTCSKAVIYCSRKMSKINNYIILKYYVDPSKLPESGNWACQYKGKETRDFIIKKILPSPTSTITTKTFKMSSTSTSSSVQYEKDSSVSSNENIDTISTVPPTNIWVSKSKAQGNNRVPYTVWHFLSHPVIICFLIITLVVSLLINLWFLIRCVLLNTVIENNYRGISTSLSILYCFCLDDRHLWPPNHFRHGSRTDANSSQAALALLAAHGNNTTNGSVCDHHTATTLLGANTPSSRIYYDKNLSHSFTPLLMNKTGTLTNDVSNNSSLPHFYRCQGNGTSTGTIAGIANGNGGHQIPTGAGVDSLQQIYDDLSNGSAVIHPPMQNSVQATGYYHPKYSLQQSTNSNNQPSSDIMLLDNSSTITNNQNSILNNINDTNNNNSINGADIMTVGNQTPQAIPNGSLSRQQSLSNHSNINNSTLPNNHPHFAQPSYYHPSLGNYVIVSGPVVANNDNQYTIATNNTHGSYIQHGYPNYQYHQHNYNTNQIPPSHISGVSPIPSAPGSLIGGSGITNNSGATNSVTSNSNPNINPSASSPQIINRNTQNHASPIAVINATTLDNNTTNIGGIITPNCTSNTNPNSISNHHMPNISNNNGNENLMDNINNSNQKAIEEESTKLLSNEDRSVLSRHPHQTLPATPDVNHIPQYASITPLTRMQIDNSNTNNNNNGTENINTNQEAHQNIQNEEDPTLPLPPPHTSIPHNNN